MSWKIRLVIQMLHILPLLSPFIMDVALWRWKFVYILQLSVWSWFRSQTHWSEDGSKTQWVCSWPHHSWVHALVDFTINGSCSKAENIQKVKHIKPANYFCTQDEEILKAWSVEFDEVFWYFMQVIRIKKYKYRKQFLASYAFYSMCFIWNIVFYIFMLCRTGKYMLWYSYM